SLLTGEPGKGDIRENTLINRHQARTSSGVNEDKCGTAMPARSTAPGTNFAFLVFYIDTLGQPISICIVKSGA
ncbi:hypothetical protein ACCS96_51820, partial [Rhizobium ruizarguesonis]